MSERAAENEVTTVPEQPEVEDEEDRSRGGGKGGEQVKAEEENNVAAFLSLKPEQMQEDRGERAECQVPAAMNKPGRVQSVFCLVRDQIRGQPCREASRTGMLQLVQHVTRQLDRTKVEQEALEVQDKAPMDLENEQANGESKKDECVVLLEKILCSIEGLRKEVGG